MRSSFQQTAARRGHNRPSGTQFGALSSVPALLVIIVQLLLQLPSVSPRPASLASWHPAFDLAVASLRRSQDNNKWAARGSPKAQSGQSVGSPIKNLAESPFGLELELELESLGPGTKYNGSRGLQEMPAGWCNRCWRFLWLHFPFWLRCRLKVISCAFLNPSKLLQNVSY